MTVIIYKNEQQYGPYSIDQIRVWVSSGQISPTDLACYEGATTWLPLSTLLLSAPTPATATANNPPSWGWSWLIAGLVLGFIGGLLCVTIIGAIIGIPLLVVTIPMTIYGCVKMYRRQMWNMTESVRLGVVQGMPSQGYLQPQQYWQQPRLPAASTPLARFCSNCAATLDADAKFCPSCAAPTS